VIFKCFAAAGNCKHPSLLCFGDGQICSPTVPTARNEISYLSQTHLVT